MQVNTAPVAAMDMYKNNDVSETNVYAILDFPFSFL
jgi:uncharacterized protein YceK